MTDLIDVDGKQAAYFGVPWEEGYGYAQAIRVGDSIFMSGQFNHDREGKLIAPAELNSAGKPADFSAMEAQMRDAYANAEEILGQFGATLDDVVEETISVIDMESAFAVAGKVRKEAFGTDRPLCASTIVGVTQLSQPAQLIEISFRAVLART